MRHRVQDKKFNRDSNERKALFLGLFRNLAERGAIVTTRARAKALKRFADQYIHQGQDNSLASRRTLHKSFGKKDLVNTVVDRIAPAMNDRVSGFTRIIPMGNRRGDNTPMVKIELVNKPSFLGTLKAEKPREFEKTAKAAKPAAAAKPVTKTKTVAKKAPVKAKKGAAK
jgi:large subunit ribosomal protein L17